MGHMLANLGSRWIPAVHGDQKVDEGGVGPDLGDNFGLSRRRRWLQLPGTK